MKPIRIAITDMPRMLREIIEETVAAEPGMEVVGDAHDDRALAALAVRLELDVMVSSAEPSPSELAAAFSARPGLRVIVLDRHDGRGILHELRPDRVALGDASPQRLVSAIREHVGEVAVP